MRRFDGEYRWFNTRGDPVRDDSGRIARWYLLATDIEDRKRAEHALRSAFDGIAGLVSVIEPNGKLKTVNRQVLDYFGRSLEELKQWETSDAVHPEDLPRVLELFKKTIASGIPSTSNYACGASTANIGGLKPAASQYTITPGASCAGTLPIRTLRIASAPSTHRVQHLTG